MKEPTLEEIQAYKEEKNYTFDAEEFLNYQKMVGWVYGKSKKPIKSWKAAMATFQKNQKSIGEVRKLDNSVREDKFWSVMINAYGAKWTSQHGKVPQGLWVELVQQSTPEMLNKGVAKSRELNKEWPPTIWEFEKYCLPDEKELGLPEKWEAFRQALNNHDKHPAVIHALRNMQDVYRFRTESEERALTRFEKVWEKTVLFVATGGILPEKEKQIAAPVNLTTREQAKQKIRELLRR